MSEFGLLSYAAAALGFAGLTLLLLVSWRGRRAGVSLIAACAVSAVWAGVLSAQSARGTMAFLPLYVVEMARSCAWLFVLVTIAGVAAPPLLLIGGRILLAVLVAVPLALPVLERAGLGPIDAVLLLSRAGLALSLLALILLEQIYRNSTHTARRSVKYLVLGVGGVFAYDLFLYSQSEVLRSVSIEAWSVRGLINVCAVPLVAMAARRNRDWSLDIFVSRQVVFYTTTFLAVGVYLVVMACGGYYVRQIGGSWGNVGQIFFMAGAGVILATLLVSSKLRRHTRVFLSKHFYRNKYDYRAEWLRFIATLSSTAHEDVRSAAVRSMVQIFSSPGGVLFVREEEADTFVPYGGWPAGAEAVPGIDKLRAEDDLPQFLSRTQWIVDMEELRRSPDIYGNLVLPPWLQANANLRIISPLLQLDRLVGFVVLYAPPLPFELTYEDRDLLKTVGRHVATHLAQAAADRKLAESRQFEAYNRLTAFMMHDLKNSAAQLKLIVDNAERHKRNPEFIDDAIGTIANAVERMTRLIEQLRGSTPAERAARVDLGEIAREAARRCAVREPRPLVEATERIVVWANLERLTTVIEHIVRNAQDAAAPNGGEAGGRVEITVTSAGAQALLTVSDNGSGMDAAFLRERLFRPFDSTKGSKGMGIGAYQVREYIRLLGGNVEVQSSPGQGTRFMVSLPLSEQAGAGSPLAQAG